MFYRKTPLPIWLMVLLNPGLHSCKKLFSVQQDNDMVQVIGGTLAPEELHQAILKLRVEVTKSLPDGSKKVERSYCTSTVVEKITRPGSAIPSCIALTSAHCFPKTDEPLQLALEQRSSSGKLLNTLHPKGFVYDLPIEGVTENNFSSDFGLIGFDCPEALNLKIIAPQFTKTTSGQQIVGAGFGLTVAKKDAQTSEVLNTAKGVVRNSDELQVSPAQKITLQSLQSKGGVLIQNSGGERFCLGDSGGPLITSHLQDPKKLAVMGILSVVLPGENESEFCSKPLSVYLGLASLADRWNATRSLLLNVLNGGGNSMGEALAKPTETPTPLPGVFPSAGSCSGLSIVPIAQTTLTVVPTNQTKAMYQCPVSPGVVGELCIGLDVSLADQTNFVPDFLMGVVVQSSGNCSGLAVGDQVVFKSGHWIYRF